MDMGNNTKSKYIIAKLSLIIFLFFLSMPLTAKSDKNKFMSYIFFNIQKADNGYGINIFGGFGYKWKMILSKIYTRLKFQNHYLYLDSSLSVNFYYKYKTHNFFAGPLIGIKSFNMGYNWSRMIYGLNIGYMYRISRHFYIGTEYMYYMINGSNISEYQFNIMPVFKF